MNKWDQTRHCERTDLGIKTDVKKMETTGRRLRRGHDSNAEISGALVPWGRMEKK